MRISSEMLHFLGPFIKERKKDPTVEVEFRFFHSKDISLSSYLSVLSYFNNKGNYVKTLEESTLNRGGEGKRRIAIGNDLRFEQKFTEQRLMQDLSPTLNLRLVKSREVEINPKDFIPDSFNSILRTRSSFQHFNSETLVDYRVDLTYQEHKSHRLTQEGKEIGAEDEMEREEFHVEVEVFDHANYEALLTTIERLILNPKIIPEEENDKIVKEYNAMFASEAGRQLEGSFFNYENKPISLEEKSVSLLVKHYAATPKLDGIRYLCFISTYGVILIQPTTGKTIKLSGYSPTELIPSLFDGEYMDPYYHVFDCIFFKGENTRYKNLIERFDKIERFIYHIPVSNDMNSFVKLKKFFMMEDTLQNLEMAIGYSEAAGLKIDGFILQPVFEEYKNKHTFKFKPLKDITIDFMLEKNKEKEDYYFLIAHRKNKLEKFTGSREHPFDKSIFISPNFIKNIQPTKVVIEFGWDKDQMTFKPHRVREDKIRGNDMTVVESNWRIIHNPLGS